MWRWDISCSCKRRWRCKRQSCLHLHPNYVVNWHAHHTGTPKWWRRNEMLQQKHTFYVTANAWINLSVQRVFPHYFQKASPSNSARGRRCVAGHSKTMYCFPHATDSRAKIPKGTFLKPPRAPSHAGSRLAFLREVSSLYLPTSLTYSVCLPLTDCFVLAFTPYTAMPEQWINTGIPWP